MLSLKSMNITIFLKYFKTVYLLIYSFNKYELNKCTKLFLFHYWGYIFKIATQISIGSVSNG